MQRSRSEQAYPHEEWHEMWQRARVAGSEQCKAWESPTADQRTDNGTQERGTSLCALDLEQNKLHPHYLNPLLPVCCATLNSAPPLHVLPPPNRDLRSVRPATPRRLGHTALQRRRASPLFVRSRSESFSWPSSGGRDTSLLLRRSSVRSAGRLPISLGSCDSWLKPAPHSTANHSTARLTRQAERVE